MYSVKFSSGRFIFIWKSKESYVLIAKEEYSLNARKCVKPIYKECFCHNELVVTLCLLPIL